MGIFGLSSRVDEVEQRVVDSFAKVKQDTELLYQWIDYLNNIVKHQHETIKQLRFNISQIPSTREEIKAIIDQHYAFEPILRRIKELEHQISVLLQKKELEEPLQQAVQQQEAITSRDRIRERIAQRLAQNSKTYVKKTILGLVQKYGEISALQLREIVVDEQRLCSRSSFYRILEEIERDGLLEALSDGKMKHYMPLQEKKYSRI